MKTKPADLKHLQIGSNNVDYCEDTINVNTAKTLREESKECMFH